MELKVNIIGLGIMGRGVGRALMRNPMVHLTAGADLAEENLASAKDEFALERTYRGYGEMLEKEKPDAVFVATPDWAHHDPVMACLDAGVHGPSSAAHSGCASG